MDETTRKVLQKWRRNWDKAADGKLSYDDIDGDDCAYCEACEDSCTPCPIFKKTGHPDCDNTPYPEIWKAMKRKDLVAIKTHVWAELQFLLQIAWEEEHEKD